MSINHASRYELYVAGRTDVEIAAIEGVSRQAIHRWRQKRGLPAKHRPGNFHEEPLPKWLRT